MIYLLRFSTIFKKVLIKILSKNQCSIHIFVLCEVFMQSGFILENTEMISSLIKK